MKDLILQTNDFVGLTFWLISLGTIAATAFFFAERNTVAEAWKTSVTVAGVVTGVAFLHYIYIRGIWIHTGDAPTVYRYIDWLITLPLQTITFYLIISAVRKAPSLIFWKLLIASLVMSTGGYLGEAGYLSAIIGFVIELGGFIYIVFELFSGASNKLVSGSSNRPLKIAFSSMRMIVAIGWAIYPIGYLFGYVIIAIDVNTLNAIYNLADFVNKIAFGLIIWSCAIKNTYLSKR